MNERIGQLAEQAGIRDNNLSDGDMSLTDLEKFAELIVKECIDTLEKRFMGDLNREDQEVRRCIDALKQHFGDINERTD